MKAVVTGATGFIGGAAARRMLDLGWEVTLLARPGSQPPPHLAAARVVHADLGESTPKDLRAVLPACDVVVHAAAIRNRWGTPPERYQRVNVDGTRNLAAASVGYAKRFVFISSSGVYGYPGVLGIDEDFPTVVPASPLDYHASKVLAEQALLELYGSLPTVILRPTITYGPGDSDGMITRMVQMIRRQKLPRIGAGNNFLHLTFISDMVDAIIAAGREARIRKGVYNVCGPEPIRFNDLARGIAVMVERPFPTISIPRAAAYGAGWLFELAYLLPGFNSFLPHTPLITRQMVNNVSANRGFSGEKAREDFGFTPRVSLAEGLQATLAWMQSEGIYPL